MIQVAKDYGLSDRGLAKLCERNDIPVPPRGYWARKRAGYKVRQMPLPARKEEGSQQIIIQKHEHALPQEVMQAMETAQQRVQATALVPLSSPESDLHKAIKATAKALRKAKPSAETASANANGHCGVTVGLASVERAIVILDAIARALDEQGLALQPLGTKMRIAKDQNELTFTLTEYIQKQQHVPTPEEKAKEEKRLAKRERDIRLGIYSYSNEKAYPEYDFIRTGELGIQITDEYVRGARRSWKDGKRQRLEDMIDEIAVGMVAYLAGIKARREERERWHEQYRINQERREIATQHRDREGKRREFVIKAAEKITEIDSLEKFLLQIQVDSEVSTADEFTRMVEWVRDRIDSLKAGLEREKLLSSLQKNELFPENDTLIWVFAEPE